MVFVVKRRTPKYLPTKPRVKTRVTRVQRVYSIDLGGLCWHNFEHNRTPEHKGITEQNRKKNTSIFTKINITE